MAAGDSYIDCTNQTLSNESLLRLLVVVDCNNKPALRTYTDCSSGGGGGGSFPVSVQRTPSFTRVTNASSVPLGARSVSFYNSGATDGSVLGTTLHPGEYVTFTATLNDTLAAIAYVATGTEFTITTLV